jgi:hypothetical protein
MHQFFGRAEPVPVAGFHPMIKLEFDVAKTAALGRDAFEETLDLAAQFVGGGFNRL